MSEQTSEIMQDQPELPIPLQPNGETDWNKLAEQYRTGIRKRVEGPLAEAALDSESHFRRLRPGEKPIDVAPLRKAYFDRLNADKQHEVTETDPEA